VAFQWYTTDQCMLKFKMLLKGSQFYYHSNTLFDAFGLCLPQNLVLMEGGGEDDRHATIGGKQRKTV
jgi:hypothetical protein